MLKRLDSHSLYRSPGHKALSGAALLGMLTLCSCVTATPGPEQSDEKQNIIFILTDDQRFDELGIINPQLNTPNLDRLANEGVHFENAFVSTSLCSPSRATILTGEYMHNHGVVDNNIPPREGTVFFPQYLQQAGYNTALIGKWHLGERKGPGKKDAPQPGFDHWVSFAGQGNYYPVVKNGKTNVLNVNGKHVPQEGYITDELTDYAIDWLDENHSKEKTDQSPFFLYLSHKAVHAHFYPAERHKDQYSDMELPPPASQADTPENYKGKPMWVKNQRNSWHGVDFPLHSRIDVQEYKRDYHRSLSAVDDSLGRVLAWLEANGHADNTTIIFMGDNGYLFGEHGLIDKRNAYEESMRVPMLAWSPGKFKQGYKVKQMVSNLDIAPTILDLAGVSKPENYEGLSLAPLGQGKHPADWREDVLYEYYWEFNYPHTPTVFALREDRYKFIMYHGVWDTEELYDLKNDPNEMHNLIDEPEHFRRAALMRQKLYHRLQNSQGQNTIPYSEKFRRGAVLRHEDGSKAAEFPQEWLRDEHADDLRGYIPDLEKIKK